MMLRRDNEKGRSMVEMMGYMAVAISLVAAVGHLVSKAFDEYKYSKAYIQLTDLVGSIVRASAIDADYEEVVKMINGECTEESRNKEGQKLIPNSYRRIGNTLYHAFGGKVTVSLPPIEAAINFNENPGSDAVVHSEKLAVTFEGLTRKQCIEMALKDWNNNNNIDLYAIIINSAHYWYWPAYTVFNEVEGVVVDNTLPVTRVAVTGTGDEESKKGQCDRDKNNTIMWIFN